MRPDTIPNPEYEKNTSEYAERLRRFNKFRKEQWERRKWEWDEEQGSRLRGLQGEVDNAPRPYPVIFEELTELPKEMM